MCMQASPVSAALGKVEAQCQTVRRSMHLGKGIKALRDILQEKFAVVLLMEGSLCQWEGTFTVCR